MKREYDDDLRDMLANAELALDFVQDMEYDEFFEDEKSKYAVMRALEVIGEAACKVPEMYVIRFQKSPGVRSQRCGIFWSK